MKLMDHQVRFVQIVRALPRFLWAAEPGCGKTIGALAACADNPMKTVVLAPKSILESAWGRDAQHFRGMKVTILSASDSPAQRLRTIQSEWDILITNYDQFKRYAKDLLVVGTRRLIVDESSKIRNSEAKITQACIAFADRMESVILLSGSPAPNNFTEYMPQDRAINGPRVKPYYQWAYSYGNPKKEWVNVRGGRRKEVIKGWSQTPEQHKRFIEDLRKWSWALSKEECLDLPPQVDRVIDVRLNAEELHAYGRVCDAMRIELKSGKVSRIRAEAVLGKLRQIVGGAVYVDGDAATIGGTPSKMEALGDIADELAGEPFIVWFQYRHERDRLVRFFHERGQTTVGVIDGSTSDRAGEIAAAFQRGDIPVLLAHPAAAAHGITLTRASHAVYYSLDFSFENWEQSRGRIHRAGMGDKPATYTVLLGRLPGERPEHFRTVDHAMHAAVLRKGNQSDAVLDALRLAVGEEAEVIT